MMNLWNQFWWVIFPYLMLASFIIGHIYRYTYDPYGWKAKSSEFLEKKRLRWGSILFHVGILMVFGGHVMGLLIPKSWMNAIGFHEEAYHVVAVYFGGLAGLITLVGITLLLVRRLSVKRIRVTSSVTDLLVAAILFILILNGVANTIGFNLFTSTPFDYRETIAPWLRGLLTLSPDAHLMSEVPFGFKFHVILAFFLFGLWPYTRLVHVWSLPLEYLGRSYILYRSRNGRRTRALRKIRRRFDQTT